MRALWQRWAAVNYEAEGVGGAAAGGDAGGAASPGGGENSDGSGGQPALVQEALKNSPPGANGAANGQNGAGDGGNDPGGAAQGYWPDGLPEPLQGLRGTDDKTTIDKLLGHLRDQPRAPEKPADYKLELPEDFIKRFGDLAKDPAVAIWRNIAHELGLDDKGFNTGISKLYQQMSEAGLIEEPINPLAELEKLAPAHGDTVSRKAQASARIQGVFSKIDGLVTRQTLTKAQGNRILAMAADAEGVMTLEALFKGFGEHGLQGGGMGGGGASVDDLKKDMSDERYDSTSPKFDKAFRERVDRQWREIHGVK